MHVLHRPHLPRLITVTVLAAVMAIVLTLAVASGLSDHGAVSAPSVASRPAATVSVSATGQSSGPSAFTRSPFSSLLTKPLALPWAQNSR